MIRTLLKEVKQYKVASILTPVFTAMEVVMDVLIPWMTAKLIDSGINAGNLRNVYIYGSIMVGMALLSLFFGIMAGNYSAYASAGFAANLRKAMYRNIQTFSFSDIDKYSTSGLVTRMTTDVTNLQNAYQQILRITVRAPFRLLSCMVMCFIINVKMSLIFVVALVVLSCALYYILSHVSKLFRQVFEKYDLLNESVQENVDAIRLVKSYVREKYENEKFANAAGGLYKLFVKAESLMAYTNPIMNMVIYGCIIAISWFGAHFIVGGTLTTGELTSMFSYIMSIMMALMLLSMIFVMISMSAASGERVAAVIDEKADIVNPENPVMEVADGSVQFDKVCFAYNTGSGEYAIRDLNFSIRSGETIGVIGGTGSGKSSLVNLICRLYDVSKGTVSVGGIDVRRYDLGTLRDSVSVVLQNNVLFSGTILDNLRWGNENATLEECQRVCHIAQADEFIDQMPNGYETRIEQGGTNVSGGQKQRLCIARALLKNPKILILDDSTSACDTATDANIRREMTSQLSGMTKIIIAQRIASIRNCSRIMVLDNGKIIGFGTHDELLETCKLYREIFQIQIESGGDFDETSVRKGVTA